MNVNAASVLLVGPNPVATNDGVIIRGIDNLLYLLNLGSLSPFVRMYHVLDDHDQEEPYNSLGNMDIIIVCGTPFVYDKMETSNKFRNLAKIFAMSPKARKILLGIGSCFCLHHDPIQLLTEDTRRAVQEHWGDALIICRDKVAKLCLEYLLERDVHYLPCPGFWALHPRFNVPIHWARKKETAVMWYDPNVGIASVCEDGWDAYIYTLRKSFSITDYPVYCQLPEEVESFHKYFGGTCTLLTNPMDHLSVIPKYKHWITGRVHTALPASASGHIVTPIAIDTRMNTFKEFRGTFESNLSAYTENYKKSLLTFLSSA